MVSISINKGIFSCLCFLILLLTFLNLRWLFNGYAWFKIDIGDLSDETLMFQHKQNPLAQNQSIPVGGEKDDNDGNEKVQHLIIAGSQKAGTTAVWKYLIDHPQVLGNKRRKERQVELHFFDNGPPRRNHPNGTIYAEDVPKVLQSYQWYWNFTLDEKEGHRDRNTNGNIKVTMEKTPIYMFDPKIVHEIKSIVPSAKIIIMLRDPVERAYSHYKMLITKRYFKRMKKFFLNAKHDDTLPVSFKDCVKMDIGILEKVGFFLAKNMTERDDAWMKYLNHPLQLRCDSIVGRGIYSQQLNVWWKLYNEEERRDQFLILKSESLQPDTQSGMIDFRPVTNFLGISEVTVNGTEVIHASNKIMDSSSDDETRLLLRELYAPYNKELETLLGKEWESFGVE